jgi:hypothetical protein
MFADPTTVTIDGNAKALVRINQDQYSSEYLLRSTTDEFRLRIRNTSFLDRKRNVTIDRHNVELIQTIFPVAPATLSTVRKAYIVLENQQGDTLADPVKMAAGLYAWLTASTNANLTKLVNFES